mmetsp:Transcript_763/g.1982  ORF Transcript_763/g.1982 Transcript_763/m.1982 type:complete len:216 (-) Transcript_763:697-1344(-)
MGEASSPHRAEGSARAPRRRAVLLPDRGARAGLRRGSAYHAGRASRCDALHRAAQDRRAAVGLHERRPLWHASARRRLQQGQHEPGRHRGGEPGAGGGGGAEPDAWAGGEAVRGLEPPDGPRSRLLRQSVDLVVVLLQPGCRLHQGKHEAQTKRGVFIPRKSGRHRLHAREQGARLVRQLAAAGPPAAHAAAAAVRSAGEHHAARRARVRLRARR